MADKKTDIQKIVNIKNRRASFEYSFIDTFDAGMVLKGTEIKSIRMGKVNMQDAFCYIADDEIFVKDLHISPYDRGFIANHEAKRDRKLLLKKREIERLKSKMNEQGLTIVVKRIYVTDRGFAKLEIALAKGKKLHDKRDDIKEKDVRRELDRQKIRY